MKIWMWHVHGSYMTTLVQGGHEFYVPVVADRGPDGRGRAETWDWPETVHEVSRDEAADIEVDLAVLQRPEELDTLAEDWLGRRPGRDIPTVYLEHNAPQGRINELRHPAADRPDLTVVHVTHFNDLLWDVGTTRSLVVEHGIIDPGHRYTGELPHLGMVINEPGRRSRVTGSDLIERFATVGQVDLFGMGSAELGGLGNLAQAELHTELPKRRVYVHPFRWTSLGLALLEAMHLGMPVVALATTEAPEAVPPGAGVISTDVAALVESAGRLLSDPEEANRLGKEARNHAVSRYGLDRFLADWNAVFERVAA